MSAPRFLHLHAAQTEELFRETAVGALIIGDAAVRNNFDLSALAYFAATTPVAEAQFWGRRAAYYRDLFDERFETVCATRNPPRRPTVRSADRFEYVDFLIEAERIAGAAAPAPERNIAILAPSDPLESRLIAALSSHAILVRRGDP